MMFLSLHFLVLMDNSLNFYSLLNQAYPGWVQFQLLLGISSEM